MKLLCKGIKGLWYFVLGHIIASFAYEKKYLSGRWFDGKLRGLCSHGWEWVVTDYRMCKKLNVNRDVPWPISPRNQVVCPDNLHFHTDDLNNMQSFGIYFQALGRIDIGRGTYIGPNVGFITSNHDMSNLDKHLDPKPISIGKKCWIGMNSVILGGVKIGNNTIVGAGSVVTHSFIEGNCIIAGNPAKIIKQNIL